MYSCEAKLHFQHNYSSLQSHAPSEIILICWVAAKEILCYCRLSAENSCAASNLSAKSALKLDFLQGCIRIYDNSDSMWMQHNWCIVENTKKYKVVTRVVPFQPYCTLFIPKGCILEPQRYILEPFWWLRFVTVDFSSWPKSYLKKLFST